MTGNSPPIDTPSATTAQRAILPLEYGCCEVCGKPAEYAQAELGDGEPVPDRHGQLWRTVKATGTVHAYCGAHVPQSLRGDRVTVGTVYSVMIPQ